ncbi:uracil phosphoribosyltransferase [Bacteroidota bacterium]
MKIINLSESNSLLNHFIAEIRDVKIQGDRMRFRRNLERIGEVMSVEISKTFPYTNTKIQTPLGEKQTQLATDQLVIASILRAGLPFHQGFLNYFDHAENAFIAAYRKHTSDDEFTIELEYIATPDLSKKILILADPMLASAWSMEQVFSRLLEFGKPKQVHLAAVIAAQPGIDYISEKLRHEDITLWTATLDPELNSKSYIVPGLGDAGDLAFGEKL